MNRVIIFGNSGSGKSTLAKRLTKQYGCAHLDLDTIAWLATTPPQRQSLDVSQRQIDDFVKENESWVIEGCYADLLELVAASATKAIFLNLPVSQCIENAKNRPFEPHKYESKAAQDANLEMLIDWIAQYDVRNDTFSKQAHQKLYAEFTGEKNIILTNQ